MSDPNIFMTEVMGTEYAAPCAFLQKMINELSEHCVMFWGMDYFNGFGMSSGQWYPQLLGPLEKHISHNVMETAKYLTPSFIPGQARLLTLLRFINWHEMGKKMDKDTEEEVVSATDGLRNALLNYEQAVVYLTMLKEFQSQAYYALQEEAVYPSADKERRCDVDTMTKYLIARTEFLKLTYERVVEILGGFRRSSMLKAYHAILFDGLVSWLVPKQHHWCNLTSKTCCTQCAACTVTGMCNTRVWGYIQSVLDKWKKDRYRIPGGGHPDRKRLYERENEND